MNLSVQMIYKVFIGPYFSKNFVVDDRANTTIAGSIGLKNFKEGKVTCTMPSRARGWIDIPNEA